MHSIQFLLICSGHTSVGRVINSPTFFTPWSIIEKGRLSCHILLCSRNYDGCLYHGCTNHDNVNDDDIHPLTAKTSNPKTYKEYREEKKAKTAAALEKNSEFIDKDEYYEITECQFRQAKKARHSTNTLHRAVHQAHIEGKWYQERPMERLVPRAALRGLRTILYSHVFKESPENKFYALDKSSLYPYAGLTCHVPYGMPKTYIGRELKEALDTDIKRNGALLLRDQIVNGLIHCAFATDKSDQDPFIMIRFPDKEGEVDSDANFDKNKRVRNLCVNCTTCAIERSPEACQHKGKETWIVGHFTSIEVSYAVLECGYELKEVFEIMQWPMASPLLRDFLQILGRRKLLASKLPPGMPDNDLKEYCDIANREMLFPDALKVKPTDFQENKDQREFFKQCLNEFLGVFAMNVPSQKCHLIYNKEELHELFYKKTITQIQPLSRHCMSVVTEESQMKPHSDEENPRESNKITNKPDTYTYFPIYAFIVAQARIIMHRDVTRIRKEGGKVYSLHCDAILFSFPRAKQHPFVEKMGEIFGFYKDDLDGEVISFVAKNERTVSIVTRKPDGSLEQKIKVNGLAMGLEIVQNQLPGPKFDKAVIANISKEIYQSNAKEKDEDGKADIVVYQPIKVYNQENPYLEKVNFRKFTIKSALKSRVTIKNFDTKPYGYNK